MQKNNQRIIKNIKGMRLLERTYLDYSMSLLELISKNSEIEDILLRNLEVTKDDFYKYLSGDVKGNITFYNEALLEANYLVNKKGMNK